jgi:hypothetical protein
VSKPSKIAIELEKHEKRLNASEGGETFESPGKKRRGSGRVRDFFKDQLVRRTSTKR